MNEGKKHTASAYAKGKACNLGAKQRMNKSEKTQRLFRSRVGPWGWEGHAGHSALGRRRPRVGTSFG